MSYVASMNQAASPPSIREGAASSLDSALRRAWRVAQRGGATGLALYEHGAADAWQRGPTLGEGVATPMRWVATSRLQGRASRRPPPGAPATPAALWIPLSDGTTLDGWLAVLAPKGAPLYQGQTRRAMLRTAARLGLAARAQRLSAEASRTQRQMDLLRRLPGLIEAAMDQDRVLARLTDEIAAICGVTSASIFRLKDDQLVRHAWPDLRHGGSVAAVALAEGIVSRAAQTRQTQRTPMASTGGATSVGAGAASIVAVPLQQHGQALGVLVVESVPDHPLRESDVVWLEALAGHISALFDNARLVSESEQRLASLSSLWAMSADLSTQQDLPALLESLIQRAAAVANAASGAVFLLDPRSDDLVLTVGYHWPADAAVRLAPGEGAAGRAVQARVPLVSRQPAAWDTGIVGGGALGGATLAVPIIWAETTMGAVVLTHQDPRLDFDRATVQIVSAFAAQAASAIHTVRLYEAEQRKARQLEAIHQINRQVAMSLDRQALLGQVVSLVASHLRHPTVCVYLIAGDYALPAAGDVDREAVHLGEGVIGWVAQMGQSVLVPDGEPTRTLLAAGTLPTSRAQLAVPISMGSQILGVLDVQSQTPNDFDEVDELGLSAVASQTAVALINAEHYQDATRRAEELSALYATAQAVAVELSLDDVLHTIVDRALDLTQAMESEVNLLTVDQQRVCVAAAGRDAAQRQGRGAAAHEGLLGVALREGRAMLINNAQADPRIGAQGRDRSVTGMVIVPLQVKGETIGALTVANGVGDRAFTQRDLRLMRVFAQQAALALNNAQMYELEREHVQQLGLVNRVARLTTASLEVDAVLDTAVRSLTDDLGLLRAAVLLRDSATGALKVQAVSSRDDEIATCVVCAGAAGGLCHAALGRGEVAVMEAGPDARQCCLLQGEQTGYAVAAPLRQGEQALGVLLVVRDTPEPFKPTDVAVMQAVADQLAAAVTAGRLYQATVEARERAETIMNEAQAGLVVVDARWRVQALNATASVMLDTPALAAVGQPVGRVLDDPRTDELLAQAAAVAAKPGSRAGRMVEAHLQSQKRDVLMGVAPLRPGYLISLVDVTALKEVDRLKSEIIANFSHELRAPLSSIKAYTELLLHFHGRSEDLPLPFLTIVDQETDRLTDLVNDVLDLSRLEAGRPQMEPTAVPLPDVIDEVVRMTAMQAAARHIGVGVAIAPDTPPVWGDRQLVAMIVRNLVVNAVKYNRDDGSVFVEVDAIHQPAHGRRVRLRVRDTGIGIPPQAMPHLFEKFYRVASTTESGIQGTGIGLALVRAAVEAHHGDISVTSEAGSGTEFTVLLPAVQFEDA